MNISGYGVADYYSFNNFLYYNQRMNETNENFSWDPKKREQNIRE